MHITVRFFASIREQVGQASATLEFTAPMAVRDVWQAATGQPMPAQTLAAINADYAPPEQLVADGDEIAFFPPVTGG